jgi:membrane protease YdiL (CAAX protease family)
MESLPSLPQVLIQIAFYVGYGLVAYLLTRWLKFRIERWPYPNPRQSALVALAVIFIPMLIITFIGLSTASEASAAATEEVEMKHTLGGIFAQLMASLIVFGPALLAMKARNESWQSAGITRNNLAGSILLGCLLGLIGIVTCSPCIAGIRAGLDLSHLWAFLHFAVVGFGEEFGYRGYLQTRLIAWLGRWQGWLLASTVMALIHIPQRMLFSGMDLAAALLSSVSLIFISMLMGYVMLRTQNIVAPAIFHTFADWVGVLM